MLGPAQTSIQFVMPSGPQAFLIFFLSFFRALRTADLVMGEASSVHLSYLADDSVIS